MRGNDEANRSVEIIAAVGVEKMAFVGSRSYSLGSMPERLLLDVRTKSPN